MSDPVPPPKTPDLLDALSALRTALPISALGAGLPLMCSMFVLPWLEAQRTILAAYQDALTKAETTARPDASAHAGATNQPDASPPEDEARRRMIRLMETYLDSTKSAPDYGKQLLAWQSDLVRGYLQIVEGALRSFDRKTGG